MMSCTGSLSPPTCHTQLGDLNYRITSDVPTPTIFQYAPYSFSHLLKKDQLAVSQHAGFAFVGFIEPPITFPPTYKYLRDASLYDQRPEKKLRTPAWCDRILYRLRDPPRQNQQIPVVITEYEDVNSVLGSDHKPVYLRSVLLVKKYDEAKMVMCQTEARRRILAGELAGCVQPEVSHTEVSFGCVAFQVPSRQTIRIRNNGESNLYFRFLPRDSENHVALPFFAVSQLFGVLLPNESIEIGIILNVTTPFLKVESLLSLTHSRSMCMRTE